MLSFLLLVFLTLILVINGEEKITARIAPDGLIEVYIASSITGTFDDNRRYCSLKRAFMVEVTNQQQDDFVTGFIQSSSYLGVIKVPNFSEWRTFQWLKSGTYFTPRESLYQNWGEDEPRHEHDTCIEVFKGNNQTSYPSNAAISMDKVDGKWYDVQCHEMKPMICLVTFDSSAETVVKKNKHNNRDNN